MIKGVIMSYKRRKRMSLSASRRHFKRGYKAGAKRAYTHLRRKMFSTRGTFRV